MEEEITVIVIYNGSGVKKSGFIKTTTTRHAVGSSCRAFHKAFGWGLAKEKRNNFYLV